MHESSARDGGIDRILPLWICHAAIASMLEDARRRLPEESCGLLVGRNGLGLAYRPLRNEAAQPTRAFAAVRDLFPAQRWIRENGLKLVAIVHSHPRGPAWPSDSDLRNHFHGDIPHVLVAPMESIGTVRAFRYGVRSFVELDIRIAGPNGALV